MFVCPLAQNNHDVFNKIGYLVWDKSWADWEHI